MIDLSIKGLPNSIEVAGKPFLLDTDFRSWLKVDKEIRKKDFNLTDIAFVIHDITLLDLIENQQEFTTKLLEFYVNPNSTPNITTSNSNDILVDYEEDGEYIYASFLQAYGIDLTECDLHWHKFLALFRSLPDSTIMRNIIGYRGYKKENKKNPYEEYKKIWTLPSQHKVDEDTKKELESIFYNSV